MCQNLEQRVKKGGLRALVCSLGVTLFSAFGWLLFVIGFGWLNERIFKLLTESQSSGIPLQEALVPYYITAVCTPIYYIVYSGYVLTNLWYLGVINTLLGSLCVGVGGIVVFSTGSTLKILTDNQLTGNDVHTYLVLAFVGSILLTLGIVVSLALVPVMNMFCHKQFSSTNYDRFANENTSSQPVEAYMMQGYTPVQTFPTTVVSQQPQQAQYCYGAQPSNPIGVAPSYTTTT